MCKQFHSIVGWEFASSRLVDSKVVYQPMLVFSRYKYYYNFLFYLGVSVVSFFYHAVV